MEYKINKDKTGFLFNPHSDEIEFSMSQGLYEHLTTNEVSSYISDSLTHEYMHKVLFDKYGVTASKLFDTRQQHFRDVLLHEKIIRLGNIYAAVSTWHREIAHHIFIKKYGVDAFFKQLGITSDDIKYVEIMCKYR